MAVWINEFHYDNGGADSNEFIEIAATAGTDLTGWTIVLYNGNPASRSSYGTLTLDGVVQDAGQGVGFIRVTATGLQNGGTATPEPDGFALVNKLGQVVELLSYEGAFAAANGPAAGLTSQNVGVSEAGAAADLASGSLQRTGTFTADVQPSTPGTWTASPSSNTSGAVNAGQTINAPAVAGSVSVADVTVDESAGTATFTLTRTGGTAPFSVSYATADGTAVAGADYIGATGGVSFAADVNTATVTVAISQDTADEPNETFTLALSSPTNGATISDGSAVATVNDDDAAPVPVGPSDLLISEYVEGSSNNKAVELYNGTSAAINLSGYVLQFYFNGATTATTVALTGTVAAGDTFVFAASTASAAVLAQADQTTTASLYNGDDAIVLRKGGATGTVVDSIGQVGFDPGTEWGTGLASTADNTLRLKSGVFTGDTNISDAYDPAVRYDGFATDSFDGLGSHNGGVTPPPPAGPVVTVDATDNAAVEGSAPAFRFTFTRTGDLGQPLTVTFDYAGSTASAADFTAVGGAPAPTSVSFVAGSSTAVLDFVAVDDTALEATEYVTLNLIDGADYDRGEARAATASITSDEVAVVKISQVQGAGSASLLAGQVVTVEAVVTGDFQNGDGDASRNIGGFFIQEERADEDGDAATSEGVFVYQGTGNAPLDVHVGDRVRVTATVQEFNGSTQLTAPTVTVIGQGALGDVQAATVTLPTTNLESVEHMLVTVPQQLVISEQFELDRLGEVRLYAPEGDGLAGAVAESADGRAYQYTQVYEPTTNGAVQTYAATIASRSIVYDDGLNGTYQPITNPDGGGQLTTANAPQMGDSIAGLTGIMDYGFNAFRVRSTADGQNDFADTNPREAAPAPVGGSLTVGSFNVLNFFVTLDTAGTSTDIGQDPRGADTQIEFDRQVQKLVTAIVGLNADVLGLIELENDFTSSGNPLAEGNAVSYLVDQLNLRLGGDVYSWIDPSGASDFVGGDAIAVDFIYKNDVVEVAAGTTVAVDDDPVNNRLPVAVTFEQLATGAEFTAVVNHFKSKGSGTGANADQGDGQGASNADRVAQAHELLDFLGTHPTGSTDADYVLMGDFNAYYQEDPLDVLRSGGFTSAGGPTSYSYTFDGMLGSLDHVLYSGSLASQVTGSTKWHLNSDEADALDYNLDADDTNANTNRDPSIFDGTTPYRVSDHDPILLGLNLTPSDKTLNGTAGADTLAGKNGNDTLNGLAGDDTLSGGLGNDQLNGGAGNDTLDGGEGDDVAVLGSERDGVRVYDLGGGRYRVVSAEGEDALTNVERLRFANGSEAAPIELVNDAPVAANSNVATAEDVALTGRVTATDVDGPALSYSMVNGPAHGVLTLNADGSYRYTPDADFNGPDSFAFAASDGEYADQGRVSITVTPVNDAPVADDSAASAREDTVLAAAVSATDVDSALSYTLVQGPTHGALTFGADGSYRYVPNANYNGADSFTFAASDGELSDQGVVSITVDAVDDAPVAFDDVARTRQDTAVSVNALANDVDGDPELVQPLSVRSATAANGTVAIGANGLLSYRPDEGFLGQDVITYVLSDGSTLTDTGEVKVDVIADRTGFVLGSAGADTFNGGNGADRYAAGAGNDIVRGGNGEDTLYGEMGDDQLFGGNGVDRLFGDAGADQLWGEAGDDVLSGSGGRDTLYGGAGSDRLTGGSGADVFVFAKSGGSDVITDFQYGVDRLELQDGLTVKSVSYGDIDGDGVLDTLVQFSNGSATLLGVHLELNGAWY